MEALRARQTKEEVLYLGDTITTQGLEANIEATIAHRQGEIKVELYEMKAIMENFLLQAVGGMAGGVDVLDMGISIKLLANSGSRVGVGKAAFKQLNNIQDSYLRMVHSCPPTNPIPSLQALAGVWDMEHKGALEKI